jgi:chromate transport protein ChrA
MRAFAIDTSRALASAGVLLSAVVHLGLWNQGFRNIQTIGPLFLRNVIAGLVIGAALLMWRHWLPAAAYVALACGLAAAVLLWQTTRERIA